MQPNPAISGFAPPQQPRARRFRTLRVVMALIMRETGSRETRTSLGMLWSLIDPIIAVLLLSFMFSFMQRHPRLGTNFQLYYVTGVIPFHMYSLIANRVSSSVRFSGSLLGFPSVTVVDLILARFLLNFFVNLMVFVIIATGVLLWYDLRVSPDYYKIGLSLSMAAVLGLGIGTMNALLFLWSSSYEKVWSLINRPMTVFSGVMIMITDLPEPIFRWLQWLPMAHFVSEMREAFYPSYDVNFVSVKYVLAVSAVCFIIGMIGLQRHVFDLLEKR